ncbi:MAG: glycosyltransferase [Anaerolineaceae bacterium]
MRSIKPGKTQIVFWGSDWNGHPTSSIHLARALIKFGFDVFWINSIGMRSPIVQASDFRRIIERIKKVGCYSDSSAKTAGSSLQPFMQLYPFLLPFYANSVCAFINKILMRFQLRFLKAAFSAQVLSITTFPNSVAFLDEIHSFANIYYVMDEFSTFPGVDNTMMAAFERHLLQNVDGVVFASQSLQKKYVMNNFRPLPSIVLSHGVDTRHFLKALQHFHHPIELRELDRPIIGFTGLIDERIDLDLLCSISRWFPDASVVLIGRNTVPVDALKEQRNIYMLGQRPYNELPHYLSAFDLCIMPYVRGQVTQGINPLKMKEYLAAGKDVVAINIEEIVNYRKFIHLAANQDEFCEKIRFVLENRSDPFVIRQSVAEESWEKKATELISFCETLTNESGAN